MTRILRVYCDTSVFGGCFDEEFSEASKRLFKKFRKGRFILVVSEVTLEELSRAPKKVRKKLDSVPLKYQERIPPAKEAAQLRDAYLRAGVVGRSSERDAAHIAAASVARVDTIVSWNFKHIVHIEKIRGYHGVNILHGYPAVAIHSPLEVI